MPPRNPRRRLPPPRKAPPARPPPGQVVAQQGFRKPDPSRAALQGGANFKIQTGRTVLTTVKILGAGTAVAIAGAGIGDIARGIGTGVGSAGAPQAEAQARKEITTEAISKGILTPELAAALFPAGSVAGTGGAGGLPLGLIILAIIAVAAIVLLRKGGGK